MFCKFCGSQQADDVMFCSQCGGTLKEQTPEAMEETPQKEKPVMSERKILGLIAWGLTLVVAIVMVISYFTAINTSLEDTPVMTLVLDEKDVAEFKEDKKKMVEDVDEIRDLMEDVEDFSAADQQYIDGLLDQLEKTADCLSLNNMKTLVDEAQALDEVEIDDDNGMVVEEIKSAIDSAGQEISDIFAFLMNAVLYSMLFALAFSLLGGLLRVKGLVIPGLVLSVLYSLIFCGTLFVILTAVLNLALAIICGRYRKA